MFIVLWLVLAYYERFVVKRTTKVLLGIGIAAAMLPLTFAAGASAAEPKASTACSAQGKSVACKAARRPVLSRYHSDRDHWVTSGPVAKGYRLEGRWGLATPGTRDTKTLYGCVYGTPHGPDHFISLQRNCEGKQRLRTEGQIYNRPSKAHPIALYRCNWERAVDHFVSSQSNCENPPGGAKNEGRLGYVSRA
ncbi:MAG TPA: hypothetical protein VHU91_06075 [Mycobacteriales bacterium]|nr:hypothetical protein [Mycobacteriales bacterium]